MPKSQALHIVRSCLWYFYLKVKTRSYRKQIARQLRTQYVESIYRPKYYTVTSKSRSLKVTNGTIGYIIHDLLLVELFDVEY